MGEASSRDLLGFVSSIGGGDGLRVEENLGEGFVRLRVSEAERRQAKHDIRCVEDAVIELLRNARDAGARRVFVGTGREGDLRTTVVMDDGRGIPEDMRERVFDARVTSKLDSLGMDRWGVHGRGMALYSIRERCESAQVMDSGLGRGTVIRVVSDARALPERADQSRWPSATTPSPSADALSGPHNILRACCEVALERRGPRIYFGSASEAVATVRAVMPAGQAGVLDGVAGAAGATDLRDACGRLGIELSERTAYRILSGDIRPVGDVASVLRGQGRTPAAARPGSVRPSLSREDRQEFSRRLAADFAPLAERYYLRLDTEPRVRVGEGRITVVFDISADD